MLCELKIECVAACLIRPLCLRSLYFVSSGYCLQRRPYFLLAFPNRPTCGVIVVLSTFAPITACTSFWRAPGLQKVIFVWAVHKCVWLRESENINKTLGNQDGPLNIAMGYYTFKKHLMRRAFIYIYIDFVFGEPVVSPSGLFLRWRYWWNDPREWRTGHWRNDSFAKKTISLSQKRIMGNLTQIFAYHRV